MKNKSLLISILLMVPSFAVASDTSCNMQDDKSTLASASTWDNLRNNKGSLKFETAAILKCGLADLPQGKVLEISSVPNKFLSNNADSSYCNSKLKETTATPYKYSPEPFTSIDNLNDWIKDFSQGSGSDGKDLYAKCDKSCSPQYTYKINGAEKNKLMLEAEVTCGHARDKDDNMYVLKAKIK